jgi:hypothetical protein
LGSQSQISKNTQICQPRNFSSLVDVQNIITPKPIIVLRCANNCWKDEKLLYILYVELQVRLWLQWHQNLIFVIAVQSSEIRCQSQKKSLFWNLLGEFKDGHRPGVPTTWGDVYPTPVSAPFVRWCRSTTQMRSDHFPSIAMPLGILSLPTLESLHITEPLTKALHEVVLLWSISLPRNFEWKFSTLSHGFLPWWNCGSKLIKSYLDTSCFEPWRFIPWASPSEIVFWYYAFLLKSLELDGIASPHSPCTIPCESWLHHNISISTQVYLSLEQECRYPIPLECILDNLTAVTYFWCSLLEDYTFESWIAWV